MSPGQESVDLATQAAEAVRRLLAEAEARAAEIVREAEQEAARIRERVEKEAKAIRDRAEADARRQIEAARRALDELGGSLAAAATSVPGATSSIEESPAGPAVEAEPQPEPEHEPRPEPELIPESPGAPEAPLSPPASQPRVPEEATAAERPAPPDNGGDAAERLVAMKLAVEGRDPASIEAELVERFGPGDRTALLREVLSRASR